MKKMLLLREENPYEKLILAIVWHLPWMLVLLTLIISIILLGMQPTMFSGV